MPNLYIVERPGQRSYLEYTEDLSKNCPGSLNGGKIKVGLTYIATTLKELSCNHPQKLAMNHKNVTRYQNALLVCSLICKDNRLFLVLHLPPNLKTLFIYHQKPLQLAYSHPNYSHIICTAFVRSSIMGLKRKSTWQKPGLTVYILSCEFLKKNHKKEYKNKINAVDNSS